MTIEETKGDEITNRKAPKGELESETPVSEVSTSDSQGEIEGKSDSQWRGFLRKLKKGPVGFNPFHPSMPSFPSLPSIKKISRKKSRNITQSLPSLPPNLDSQLCHCFEASWKNFTLPELQTATDNFSHGIQLSDSYLSYFLEKCDQLDNRIELHVNKQCVRLWYTMNSSYASIALLCNSRFFLFSGMPNER